MKHKVKQGETLSLIAKKYNVSVDAIMAINPIIKNKNIIQVGWVLTIPTKTETKTDYTAIGKKVKECMNDIQCLKSFKELEKLIGD